MPAGLTFGIGALAGVVTVYTTMPLEYVPPPPHSPPRKTDEGVGKSVIKTRMQSLEAKIQYRNSFHCAARIFAEEGVFK